MPWNADDREKIRLYCEIPPLAEWVSVLDANMAAAEESVVQSVQAALVELDSLEALLNEQLKQDASLVRADVLEWEAGRAGAGKGVRQLQRRHIDRIRLALMLPTVSHRGSGMSRVRLVN